MGEKERTLAAALIAMSGAFGTGAAFGIDTYYLGVQDELDIGEVIYNVFNM